MLVRIFFGLLLFFLAFQGRSQPLQTYRKKSFPPSKILALGNEPILPSSVFIHWKTSDTLSWNYDWRTQKIQFLKVPSDSIQVSFSILVFEKFSKETTQNPVNFFYGDKVNLGGKDFYSDLRKTGSIGRGITLGNSQNSTIQSSLNLQMEGQIHPKIFLKAALTDQTTPFQPDGTTQRIQDFDRIFIQLKMPVTEWKFGGLDIQMDSGFFLKVQRNINGVQSINIQKLPKGKLESHASIGINRGKFGRNTFFGDEGNQGPYRLTGSEQEKFLIVLANSEKVYLDGKLMQRGQDLDYTFDYNSAEIRFTPKHLITNQSRIIVEFEYLNQSYLRINHAAELKFQNNFTEITWNHYQESDQKYQFLQGKLDSNWVHGLEKVGNEVGSARLDGATLVGYQPNLILYEKKDSLGFSNVFVFSQDSSKNLYQITFTLVGAGRGHYDIGPNVRNGRTYLWKAPQINGSDTILQGAYEPIVVPVAPQSKTMETVGLQLRQKNWKFKQEFALSLFDPNTFSKLGNSQNWGMASSSLLVREDSMNILRKKIFLKNTLSHEILDSGFSLFQPYRSAEFNRAWNTPKQYSGGKENLIRWESQVNWSKVQFVKLGYSRLKWDLLEGKNWDISSNLQNERWKLNQNWRFGRQEFSQDSLGVVVQGNSELSYRISKRNKFSPYLHTNYLLEKSSWRSPNDLFIPFSFEEISSKFSWTRNSGNFYFQGGKRTDVQPGSNDFRNEQQAWFIHGGFSKNSQRIQVQWREVTLPQSVEKNQNLAIQTEGKFEKFKGALSGQWFQQSTSGKTPKRDFTFLPVAPGLGTHQWNDYNRNGIQELNEFEIAIFPDSARYIKLILPTTTYIDVFQSKSNFQVNLQPGNIFNPPWLKSIYFSSQLQQDRQTWRKKGWDGLFPQINFNPQNSPAYQSQWRNTLWINRNHPKWGFELNHLESQLGQWNSNGIDQRIGKESYGVVRWVFNKKIQFRGRSGVQSVYQFSELFQERTFNYQSWEAIPGIQIQFNSKMRWNLDGKFSQKKSSSAICEIQEMKTEFWINQQEHGQWRIQYQRTGINFIGNQRSPLGFEWMQGLVAGKNNVWGLSWNSILKNGLQAQINYQMRQLGQSTRMNHWMQMQLRYLF